MNTIVIIARLIVILVIAILFLRFIG